MLVLSRKPHEKIVFPSINTAVEIMAVHGGKVRLGIDAPREVAVFREEVMPRLSPEQLASSLLLDAADSKRTKGASDSIVGQRNHRLRNRLHAASIGLSLVRRQLQAGLIEDLQRTLDKIDGEFRGLTEHVDELSKQPALRPRTKAPKALLVEDDRNECELLAGFLRLAGFEVDTAGDGAVALDYLCAHAEQDPPDFMLLDMGLPRCDGAKIMCTIEAQHACIGTKIFAVSGHRPEEFSLGSAVNRINGWFQKPVHPEDLLCELNRELGNVS